jgi:hypothetical protein
MPPQQEKARFVRADANDQRDDQWKSAVKGMRFSTPPPISEEHNELRQTDTCG